MEPSALPKAVFFDLDGTLAQSKRPIEPAMADHLVSLLGKTRVAVTSGGMLSQLQAQVADQLPAQANLANLYLLPTSGAALFEWDGAWKGVYEELLTQDEMERIAAAVREAATQTGIIDFASPSYGERIELRGAQVTLSALGQQAPIDEKKAWDPTHEKRQALRVAINARLPDYDVKVGGSSSVDVTKKGVNKAYGIRRFSERYSIAIPDMLYVGDELSPGGNDSVVIETGIPTHAVSDPADTQALIESLVALP